MPEASFAKYTRSQWLEITTKSIIQGIPTSFGPRLTHMQSHETKDETFYCEFHTLCRLCEVSASNIHALAFFCSTNGISSTSCNEVLESQIQQKIAIYFNV